MSSVRVHMKTIYAFAIAIVSLTFSSCTKEPGEGGMASIRGKIYKEFRLVVTNPATVQNTVPAADAEVYIVYGDHVSPDERVMTNAKGEYEFMFLREGKYTVYVFSKDTTGSGNIDPDKMEVAQQVEITDRKGTTTASDMTIYDTP
jgi:hypothetical protein